MQMMVMKWLISLASTLTISWTCNAQLLPENNCAQYFQYVSDLPGTWRGEIMLPQLSIGRNRLEVRFSQRGVTDQSVVGQLLPHPDEATVRDSIGTQRAVKFRLQLIPDASGTLAKLTVFKLNGRQLCAGNEYERPNSFFNRFYEIHKNSIPAQSFNTLPVYNEQPNLVVNTLYFTQDQKPGAGFEVLPVPTTKPMPPVYAPPATATLDPWAICSFPCQQAGMSWLPPPTTAVTPGAVQFTNTQRSRFNPLPVPVPAEPAAAPPPPPPTIAAIPIQPPIRKTTLAVICGREGTITPFIQNGHQFPRGKYPWLAAIYHKESLTLAFKCGGSLISSSMVITAAHCVYKVREDRVLVGLGRYDLENYYEEGAEPREVTNIRTHPEYSTLVVPDADIALLTLERPVSFNDVIGPICLWQDTDTVITAETGSIAGWGTDERGNSMTRFPRVVEAAIASDVDCVRTWKLQSKTSNRTLCAGNLDNSGPCLGDSGGGLMVKRNNRWLLRGIVSLGERGTPGQCNLNQYVLYCDLSKHMAWIMQHFI
ncbi:serine protease 42 [Scaptodrosophila lebanonensis]|uniref:Serine protease 42 n=1 Tax=Drosophila lebanonensis TaxID=7225 RepID=A0A6J2T5N4_DROLE|nr:serine protease 42 [Scaptodrosophila lebanonensis]